MRFLREAGVLASKFQICSTPDFRRAGTMDELSGCDRRTCRRYARGEAREGYAQVSFLGARC